MYNPVTTLLFLLSLVLLIGIIVRIFMTHDSYYDDEVVEESVTTTTTTTTTDNGYAVVGNLQKQKDGSQYFVIDPVDHDKVWVNSSDDLYEDGKGQIWRLV